MEQMLRRLFGSSPREKPEIRRETVLELQAQVENEQRELMRLQTARGVAAETEVVDGEVVTAKDNSQRDDSQNDDNQSNDSQSDDSQSDDIQRDDSQSGDSQSDSERRHRDSWPPISEAFGRLQSGDSQSGDSQSDSKRRYSDSWPPISEAFHRRTADEAYAADEAYEEVAVATERVAAVNAAIWSTSRQYTQSRPEAEQAQQPHARQSQPSPMPPGQPQPQVPLRASPERAAAEAEDVDRAAVAAALKAAELAVHLRSESDSKRRYSDCCLEEAAKATENVAAINAAAWSASRQHTQSRSGAEQAPQPHARQSQPSPKPPEQPQPHVPLQASRQSQEQEQVGKERVVAVVARWQQQNGPRLRTLLAALDAPELECVCTKLLCRSVCTKLPAGSDEAAVRRAYLQAIKRVHPDKLSAQAPAQERFAAAAVFDALREANESAAELPDWRPQRVKRTSCSTSP